jgi:hypothetical protein
LAAEFADALFGVSARVHQGEICAHGRASYGFALTKYEKRRMTTFLRADRSLSKPEMDAGPEMLVAIERAEDENCQEVICLRGGGV